MQVCTMYFTKRLVDSLAEAMLFKADTINFFLAVAKINMEISEIQQRNNMLINRVKNVSNKEIIKNRDVRTTANLAIGVDTEEDAFRLETKQRTERDDFFDLRFKISESCGDCNVRS